MKRRTISQAADELNVSANWPRFGERFGALPFARRTSSGYRYYAEGDMARLPRLGVGEPEERARRWRTCLGGTYGEYLVRTVSLLWDRSGTRKASKNGKLRRRIGRVASRRINSEAKSWGEGEAVHAPM
jgi:hypothetical protein